LRCIKSAMQMRELRCKTPELVHKEVWAHILAYNLIRTVMAQAAARHDVSPRFDSPQPRPIRLDPLPQLRPAANQRFVRHLHLFLPLRRDQPRGRQSLHHFVHGPRIAVGHPQFPQRRPPLGVLRPLPRLRQSQKVPANLGPLPALLLTPEAVIALGLPGQLVIGLAALIDSCSPSATPLRRRHRHVALRPLRRLPPGRPPARCP
jgi:hypothetical protein